MKNIAAIIACTLLTAIPYAQTLEIKVLRHVLPNGLTLLMVPDHHSPSVACRLFYKIGSVNEYPGITGISHMFEHMMFKGTKRIGISNWVKDSLLLQEIDRAYGAYESAKQSQLDTTVIKEKLAQYKQLASREKPLLIKEELWNLYLQHGGTHLNAFTTDILTAYFVTLPKNKLELFFWLESDRMENAVLREFYSEREVVTEERRLRYENRPDGRYWETLNAVFYEAHPYRNPTIGWMGDIRHYTKEILRQRLSVYYRPNNAVLVLAGDFDPQTAIHQASRYFGRIAKGKIDPSPVTVQEPEQVGEKRFIVKREASPRVDILFHTPGLGDPDLYALDIVEGLLSGRSGRLYKRLVKELELCTDAGAGNGVQRYTSYFQVYAKLKQSTDPAKVEAVLLEELEKLKTDSLGDHELQRVKNNVIAHSINKLRENDELANQLGFWEVMGSWKYINVFPQAVNLVEKQAVAQAAKKYFTQTNRTVGILVSHKESK